MKIYAVFPKTGFSSAWTSRFAFLPPPSGHWRQLSRVRSLKFTRQSSPCPSTSKVGCLAARSGEKKPRVRSAALKIQVPPEKGFNPPQPPQNTFLGGTWTLRAVCLKDFIKRHSFKGAKSAFSPFEVGFFSDGGILVSCWF